MNTASTFEIVNITAPVQVDTSFGPGFHSVLTRIAHGKTDVLEQVDVLLRKREDTPEPEAWEVIVGDDQYTEPLATDAPTAADLHYLLRYLPEYSRSANSAYSTPGTDIDSLPKRWVNRTAYGIAGAVTVVTVVSGKLIEQRIDAATAVTIGRLEHLGDLWWADVACSQSRRFGGQTNELAADIWGKTPVRDASPNLRYHRLTIGKDGLCIDDQKVSGRKSEKLPAEAVARRRIIHAVLTQMGIAVKGLRHAEEIYRRLPRADLARVMDEPGVAMPAGRLFDNGRKPVVLIEMSNADVHVRADAETLFQCAGTIARSGYRFDPALAETGPYTSRIRDLRLEQCDPAALAALLHQDERFSVASYTTTYDTQTPGPTVRYVRNDDQVAASISQSNQRSRWVRFIDYEETDSWVFGQRDSVRAAFEIAKELGLSVYPQSGTAGQIDSLRLESKSDEEPFIAELRKRGFEVEADTFGISSED